ncbi:nuclear transport factor 2 family protein [Paractinoplanes durhamensis]|uniref:nuclear transport factor 2 family protein n=1 Tax=Paractinoplanes durhamensis TaxID=113563 RepID=UPI00362BD667
MCNVLQPCCAGLLCRFRERHGDFPKQRVDDWLASFESALRDRDVEAAAGLFAPDSFWRDLVAFTWNITTVEGRDGVADLLTATLDQADPRGFEVTEEPTAAGDVVEAWIRFETATGRGTGHLRLKPEGAWTLLTTLRELKGFEESQGRGGRRVSSTPSTRGGNRGRSGGRTSRPRSASRRTTSRTSW